MINADWCIKIPCIHTFIQVIFKGKDFVLSYIIYITMVMTKMMKLYLEALKDGSPEPSASLKKLKIYNIDCY